MVGGGDSGTGSSSNFATHKVAGSNSNSNGNSLKKAYGLADEIIRFESTFLCLAACVAGEYGDTAGDKNRATQQQPSLLKQKLDEFVGVAVRLLIVMNQNTALIYCSCALLI
jgi:hypothetical protein